MFIHDIIKIRYINEGYLPNYPYHMITDAEMFDAFLLPEEGFFAVNYPLLDPSLQDSYDDLVTGIQQCIDDFKSSGTAVPYWVYSYMLGNTIGPESDHRDIAYLYELAGVKPTVIDEFNAELQSACLAISQEWLNKLPVKYESRPAALFGEPHVIKSLRLASVDVLGQGV